MGRKRTVSTIARTAATRYTFQSQSIRRNRTVTEKSPATEIITELESISYDLFAKVSSRLWPFGIGKAKDEIRAIQARIDAVKWQLIENEMTLQDGPTYDRFVETPFPPDHQPLDTQGDCPCAVCRPSRDVEILPPICAKPGCGATGTVDGYCETHLPGWTSGSGFGGDNASGPV
jgi:hypothetical protein